ncbi:Surface-exposed protein OS=Tsukamurella paurometabola (strain ATCC 8368 / DSM / CCUG 35730 /CIP 100753 / JCM 10117 / KCTC 9821 / NBRC 16120 / NCIMB 702349/ NCTC 13040) OX=521096 GN=Tpau_0080 PE=4 SV=1 [Tsukamurella paurometabola]|uniref:Surface-exposed protein n=1 Tax=Tsukamurella paurometabola (strain ATCC 8368 / DSM 20162 / CCUG 35730 / CIP 100753 / JCM 10117 / KCTC 9821 / NBRC 16120 / NCIMB 702349 / NCTC 13040) TaxID=521096 RepID=D5UPW6_TSUPD|nr:hypothetical protein [Tsukamurella paurometabola]ADG76734.1 surface-exposed protein [Tsukamurella paurometabola DSM 20162]SUP41403.1 Uncharacterised protein [Tsukamurella paurometabola]
MKVSVRTWSCSVFALTLIAVPMGPAVAGADPTPAPLCVIPFTSGYTGTFNNSSATATASGDTGVSSVAIDVVIQKSWQRMMLRVVWKNLDTGASGAVSDGYDATGPAPTRKTFGALATGTGRVEFQIGLNLPEGNHMTSWQTCTAEATL